VLRSARKGKGGSNSSDGNVPGLFTGFFCLVRSRRIETQLTSIDRVAAPIDRVSIPIGKVSIDSSAVRMPVIANNFNARVTWKDPRSTDVVGVAFALVA
jgi:hypothetical protein